MSLLSALWSGALLILIMAHSSACKCSLFMKINVAHHSTVAAVVLHDPYKAGHLDAYITSDVALSFV